MPAKNEGMVDRLIRAVVGTALIVAAFTVLAGVIQWIAMIVGIVLLATGALGVCPAYLAMKFNTNSAESKGTSQS